MSNTFTNLKPKDKLSAAVSIITVSSSIAFIIDFIASTDTVQKVYIKYSLLNIKFPKPPHMDKVKLITITQTFLFYSH